MKERIVLGGRVAVEKGKVADEAIAVGQLSGGDGMFVYQSDGRFIDYTGNVAYADEGINNLVINRRCLQVKLRLDTVDNSILYTNKEYSTTANQYGDLIEKSHVIVNSIPYNINWFSFTTGTDDLGQTSQVIIRWNGLFQLDNTDTIYWEI